MERWVKKMVKSACFLETTSPNSEMVLLVAENLGAWESCHADSVHPWQAYATYKTVLETNLKKLSEETTQEIEQLLRTARVSKASGCLMSILVTKQDLSVTNAGVKAEILELRSHTSKDSERTLLHPALWEKVHGVLSGSG